MSSTRTASFTTLGSAVYIPSTSVQNSTLEEPRQEPTIAALKSEPLRPKSPITGFAPVLEIHEQINPGNKRICAKGAEPSL